MTEPGATDAGVAGERVTALEMEEAAPPAALERVQRAHEQLPEELGSAGSPHSLELPKDTCKITNGSACLDKGRHVPLFLYISGQAV